MGGGLCTETILFILSLWEKWITLITSHGNRSRSNPIFKTKLEDDPRITNTILKPLLAGSGLVSLSYRNRSWKNIPESLPYESRFSKSKSKLLGWWTDKVFILFPYDRQSRCQIPCKQDRTILRNNLILHAAQPDRKLAQSNVTENFLEIWKLSK